MKPVREVQQLNRIFPVGHSIISEQISNVSPFLDVGDRGLLKY
jgi:hypothetical protein